MPKQIGEMAALFIREIVNTRQHVWFSCRQMTGLLTWDWPVSGQTRTLG